MPRLRYNSEGISEVVSVIIIIALVAVLAAVVYALIFGSANPYFLKTSRVSASAGTVNVPLGSSVLTPVLYTMPNSGDRYYLSGQANVPSGYPVASFILNDPSGKNYIVKTLNFSASANQYGTPLYIYQDQNYNMWVTDSQTKVTADASQIRPLANGVWTITMVDNTANVPLTQLKVRVGSNGSVINPLAGTTTWANGTWDLVNSSGYQIPFTNNGVTPYPGPGGTNAFYFNGAANVTGQDNAGLGFTGDMSLSLWIDPTKATGVVNPNDGSNWGTLVGKGSLVNGVENDNYQLVQMGNQIYFEWGDTNTGQHYNIVTTGTGIANNDWNYVAVSTTSSGAPVIYINGVAQPYELSNSNTPLWNEIGACPATGCSLISGVHLANVANGITIGEQNTNNPADDFYYNGGMSAVTFYNQALSQAAVANNYNNYLT